MSWAPTEKPLKIEIKVSVRMHSFVNCDDGFNSSQGFGRIQSLTVVTVVRGPHLLADCQLEASLCFEANKLPFILPLNPTQQQNPLLF